MRHRCPICHRMAPVADGRFAPHESGSQQCSGVGKFSPAAVLAARKLLAAHDPLGEPMEILTAAGCYKCKVSGTTPTGMRFASEGGAEPPAKKGRSRT